MRIQPARKIKASAVKTLVKFPSTKSFYEASRRPFTMVLVESPLERDFCFHLESNPNVIRYFPQPKTFVVNSELMKDREYTPDFEVHYLNGKKAYIEVKADISDLEDDYLHKLSLAAGQMLRSGYDFIIVEKKQICVQPLLSNLKKIQRYRDRLSNHSGILTLLRSSVPSPETLGDLISSSLGIRMATIYKLIASNQIKADLSKEILTVKTRVHYE